MKKKLVNCPHCNSLQAFPTKTKREGDRIVSYYTCNQCRTITVIRSETPEQRIKRIRHKRSLRK